MSMLAEPRRKQKWSVDPRNSAWSNDESKFGQKMLERMGWSKGKGLGKSEQGATEHIKVKVKNNSLGLGTTISHEDNWIAHQDDFNQLLADLNNCHGQNSTEEPSPEQTEGFSLEAKSKTSKKRVHYMKFTKGKDLSNRSDTDLACIFGKRSKRAKHQIEANNSADSQEEKEQNTSDMNEQSNSEVELNTVTSTLTMQEYFAQRMAQLKKGQSTTAYRENGVSQSPLTKPESIEGTPNTSDTEECQKKKKKKKKDRKNRQGDEEEVGNMVETTMTAETAVEQADSERKKKKKKKDYQRENVADECSVPAAEMDTADGATSMSTDKKKKKRKVQQPPTVIPADSPNEQDDVEETVDNNISDKNKKKRKRQEEQSDITVAERKSKKDKTKKKSKH